MAIKNEPKPEISVKTQAFKENSSKISYPIPFGSGAGCGI
jgi:hypothetical protein